MTHFFVRNNGMYTRVEIRDILYFEGCKNYVKIVTEKKSYLALIRMKEIENMLPGHMFIRIHKSYIISLDKVTAFTREQVMMDKITLPLSCQYQSNFDNCVIRLEKDKKQLLAVPIVFETIDTLSN